MIYLLLSTILVIGIHAQGIDLTQYACTTAEDCVELTAVLKEAASNDPSFAAYAAFLESDCSVKMGFCSISCELDICGALTSYVAGLSCGTESKVCENELRCDPTNGNADCAVTANGVTGLTQCSSLGVCIPDASAECDVSTNDVNGGNTACDTTGAQAGLGSCATTMIAQTSIGICIPEACCPGGTCDDSHCITSGLKCQLSSEICMYCTQNEECDPLGRLTCDQGTGLCSTLAPTLAPTNNPSQNPSITPTASPIAPAGDSADPTSNGVRYGLLMTFLFIGVMSLRM